MLPCHTYSDNRQPTLLTSCKDVPHAVIYVVQRTVVVQRPLVLIAEAHTYKVPAVKSPLLQNPFTQDPASSRMSKL